MFGRAPLQSVCEITGSKFAALIRSHFPLDAQTGKTKVRRGKGELGGGDPIGWSLLRKGDFNFEGALNLKQLSLLPFPFCCSLIKLHSTPKGIFPLRNLSRTFQNCTL